MTQITALHAPQTKSEQVETAARQALAALEQSFEYYTPAPLSAAAVDTPDTDMDRLFDYYAAA